MARAAFILVASGDEARRAGLRDRLRAEGHSVRDVASVAEALDSIRERAPDIVVTDARIGTVAATVPLSDLLDRLARDAALIVVGGGDDLPTVENIRLSSIPDSPDPVDLLGPIRQAAIRAVARRDDRLLAQTMASARVDHFEGIIGVSKHLQRIIERIRKAARNKLTVLILGETGTGKELIARAIHNQSDRASRPFKPLNCAGLNENLLESDLFGHVRGAFTGAVADKKGLFVAADGGTLFLDEIGDMPASMQAKLLRALESREVMPVGSTEVRRVDVRVIAATNVDLRRAVEERKFREDLYYRLHQWEILVPPLRERREDIPYLVHDLLRKANETHKTSVPGLSSEAMGCLTKHYWPGNVRELANVIEAVVCEVETRTVEAEDLPESIRGTRELALPGGGALLGMTMQQIERAAIELSLKSTNGNREQAAKMLGIGTRTLYRKIKEFGL
jgi:DNA-binding NtrC family response regulator